MSEFVLVVQFSSELFDSFDALVALEEELDHASSADEVDGHDLGSGQANIYILTGDPPRAFANSVSPVLQSAGLLDSAIVAFRKLEGDQYSVLWPLNHCGEFRII